MFRRTKHWLGLLLFWFVLAGQTWAMPCDVDADGDIDLNDLNLIQQAILARAKVSGVDDPRDPDQNGLINSIDGRLCALRCTRAKCGTVNQAPFANAGPDQTVKVGDPVVLSGAASSDPDGDPLRYTWTFSSRPPASLASLLDAATVAPRFTADKPGQYLIQLIVSDGKLNSLPDTVIISTENSRPIANAGPDQSVRVGTLVTLNGGHSTDVDGDPLTYTWQLASVPPGSGATLSNPNTVNPTLLIDQPGSYLIALTVSDGQVPSLPDTVAVTTENSPPVANAGANQSIPLGVTITLDGSRSSDVDGDPLTFRWSLLARPPGSTAVLGNPSSVSPGFNADAPGTYVAQLIVNDGNVDSAPASVTLTTANAAPIAHAGPDQSVPLGSTATLDGSASRDPEGAALSYTWSLTGRPAGSNASLSGSDTVNPSFTLDRPGNYVAQLIVGDGHLASAPDTVTVSTSNSRPVADAGAAQTVTAGTAVQLDGSASRDADGDPITFAWSLTTQPPGSNAAIAPADRVSPSFIPDLAGTYIAQLIVSDGQLSSLPATVVITVAAANRKPIAVAEAIPTQTTVGSPVVLKGSASSDPDGDPLTWSWSIALRPGGSNASVVSPTTAQTSFVPDVPGVYTIQLVVRDGKVDSVPALVVVQVQALNHPPVITSTPVTTATVGQPYSYAAEAIDPDLGDVLTWSLLTAPSGMSIDPASGLVSWTPAVGQVGNPTVSVRVADQGGLLATQDFEIAVREPNHPPVITFAGIAPQWTKLAPTGTPPTPRSHVSSAYDPLTDRMIVFAGVQPGDLKTNEVWVLINAAGRAGPPEWQRLAPTGTLPGPRHIAMTAYDATANRLIMHGGCPENCGTAFVDTWVLTNANGLGGTPEWIQLPSGTSDLTAGHAYDPITNRLILFGGATPAAPFNDTSAVRVLVDANGIGEPRWIDLSPLGTRPPPRSELYALGYDGVNNRLLVFGGYRWRGIEYNDVWVLQHANGLGGAPEWQQLAPDGTAPDPRANMPSHYDPNSNRLIVFGGLRQGATPAAVFDETWVLSNANGLDGTPRWSRLASSGAIPAPRRSHAAVYDPRSNRLVTGLGYNDLSGETLNDAWVLSNASGNCTAGQPCTFKAMGTDPDAGDVLTYSLDAAPAGMTIDAASGAIIWTPASAQIGNHAVTVRVTDRGGLFATQTFTATVAPVAVPNVVGLAPEWAESFISAADLTVGTKTSQGGAITLNFDSLPSRQGWAYEAAFNPVSEERIFSLASGRLIQNSIGIPMTGHDHNAYRMVVDISPRLPFAAEIAASVLEEQATYSFGFCFDIETKPRLFGVGVGQSGLLAQGTPASLGSTTVAQLHTYRMSGTGGGAFTFSLDGEARSSGIGSPAIPPLAASSLLFGDCTGGNNARAEITAYSFTQPRVVGQNPPAGTLVPNKTAVDLTIVDGPATETVPNVIGLSQPAAEAAIVTANLKPGAVTSAPHPTIPAGQVSDQSPLPGIHVPKDTPVAIVMSTGPPAPVNVAPIITSAPVLTATAGQPYGYQVTATDANAGDALAYSLTTAPPGMQINPATGVIDWTPAAAQIGSHPVTVRVTDPGGLFDEQSFSINVSAPPPVNLPPAFTSTPIITATVGQPYTYDVNSTDDRTCENGNLILNGSFEQSSLIGVGTLLAGSTAITHWTVGGVTIDHTSFPYHWNASDGIFSIDLEGSNQPDNRGTIFQTFATCRGQPYRVLFDLSGNPASGPLVKGGQVTAASDSMTFQYDIGSVGWAANATTIRYVLQEFEFTATASSTTLEFSSLGSTGYGPVIDNVRVIPVNGSLAYSLPTAPAGMMINAVTGLVTWTPMLAQVGSHDVTVRVTDTGGLSAEQSFTIVVVAPPPVNHPPSFTSSPVVTATVGQPYAYQITASDPDAGDVLTYSHPTAPAGMTINPTTGLITWTPALAQVGKPNVTVRVTDQGGLFTEQGFTITVTAPAPVNQPPSFTSTPVTSAAAGSPFTYLVTATDPDPGDTLTYSLTTAPPGMTINAASGLIQWTPAAGQAGGHPVAIKVQDAGGLSDTQSFTVTVGAVLACAPPPAGLTSWWAGEGDAVDRANINHGSLENGTAIAAGRVGQAFRFDGADDLIRIASGRTIGFGGPFAVEFWFNPTNTIHTGSPNQMLLAKGRYLESGANAPVAIQVLGGDGRLLVRMPPAPALVSTTDTWPAGAWQHVALTWNGARYRLYINGSEEASLDNAFSILDSSDPITLGNADGFAAAGYAGLLDEVTLYNRALTAAEVTALHGAGALGKCTASYSRADAGPDQAVEVAATVTLDGSASRAFDGVALTYQWTLSGRPAGSAAILNNASAVNASFVADQPGSYTAELVVTNAGRTSAPDSVRITAAKLNHPPTITSSAITAATAGAAYAYQVTASDPDAGDTLGFSLTTFPAGMSINAASGLIQWSPSAGQIGSHNVSVRVQDSGGLFDLQSFLVVVVAAPVPISVPNVVGQEQAAAQAAITAASLTVGTIGAATSDSVPAGRVISQSPAAGTVVNSGSAVNLVISSGPPGPSVSSIRLTPHNPLLLTGQTQAFLATGILSNGSSLPLTAGVAWQSSDPSVATIDANGVATALAAGSTTIRATQGAASGEALFTVAQAVADGTLPIAQITAPADGASVASAVPIVGTASDANFLKYLIEIAPFETGVFSTLHVGTAPVSNGTLATLDPTTLVNDLYVVRLTVIDKADNRTQTEITVQLTRDKKVGNFTLAFQDLNVPMAGIPISVVRSYDSRDKTKGDFGIGWRLDVQSLRLRVTGIPGDGWRIDRTGGVLNRLYSLKETRAHKVAITLPDGKVEEFTLTPVPDSQRFSTLDATSAVYSPGAQTRGTLQPVGGTDLIIVGAQPGAVQLLTPGYELYNPAEYEYTTPEGQVILISRSEGVKQIRDRSGNTVSFAPGGIIHSAGKSITFARDGQGRISTVTDPMGNAQTYAYDINGDLASHTDAEGRRTSFLYNYEHGLIEIQDPRGVRPIRNEYDAAGRLIKSIDAYGKEITYTHDLGANRELITDRLGNTTIHVYDDLGNVTQTADPLGGVTNRSYDARGNTLSETDPLGRTRTTTYDGQDNRLTETDPLGQTTRYTYNSNRQVLTITDALGRTTSNAYDANGNLTSSTDPAGQVTTYTYDARGLQTTRTDPLGNVTQYAYDASGNLASETDPLGRVTSYSYDANGNRLTQSTTRSTAGGPETLSTRFTYDKANRLTETTHPDGSITRVAYNAIGKQSVTTDPLGRETKFDYDDMGRLTRTTYPDGSSESSAYDAEGRRTGSTDRAGRTTTSTYDPLGRLIETIAPDGSRTTTTYDAAGQVLASTDARGNVTGYEYDAAGRRSKVTDAAGAATLFTYDALGNQIQVTDANAHSVGFQYDASNRRTRTTYADGTFDQVSYDALGRQTAKTDQAGKTTQFAYDALGRLTSVTDALGQITRYGYDEQGNQLTQTDAEGRTTSFAYDRMGRRIKRTLPLGQSETFSYDAAGNLRTKTDFNGRTTTYTYDTVNRLTRKTPDGSLGQPPVVFSFTPSGQRASMQDASGSTTYSYDNRDRLLSKATPQGTLSYSYDAAGNLTRIQSNHAGGAAMDYAYDARNRLASVTDAEGRVTTYSYDAVGNLAGFLYPNGVQTTYTYNPLNRLTNVTGARGGTTIAGYTYTLGPSGNRTAVTEASGRRVDYTYDDLYRLRSETISADPAGPNGAIAYTYDRVGNRLTRVSTVAGIADQSFNYDFNDRLDGEGYDNNGNTLTSGGRTFGYDFENHLTSADGGVSFVYNGDGIRVAKTVGGVTTGFLVDERNPTGYAQVLEEIVGGAVERSYTYGLKLISQKQASGVSFYGFDGHGSVRYLTDASGSVTDKYSYEAFGNSVGQTGATLNAYLYAGEQFLDDIGGYGLRARVYYPARARFDTVDPSPGDPRTPSTNNTYLYAAADPVNRYDPLGLFSVTELGAVTAITSILSTVSYRVFFPSNRSRRNWPDAVGYGVSITGSINPVSAVFWTGVLAAAASTAGLVPATVTSELLSSAIADYRTLATSAPGIVGKLGVGWTAGVETVAHASSRSAANFLYHGGPSFSFSASADSISITFYQMILWNLPTLDYWARSGPTFSASGTSPLCAFGGMACLSGGYVWSGGTHGPVGGITFTASTGLGTRNTGGFSFGVTRTSTAGPYNTTQAMGAVEPLLVGALPPFGILLNLKAHGY
ncbi:MAG: Cell wall-associated polypeptide CWBP200 [Candidatus Accumulibacter adjunctus]|uniref:Cell wall-associated polypeptide CWBP200 n=1 Tax=Candidatus Accumulibacter adjunctus TaxID=1454001 RepID=A0A011MVG7_9PROT|nr:MAG: Cell wall-associated polypeptide CWBP200 [Candidatus Accumulibacter adjunctus]